MSRRTGERFVENAKELGAVGLERCTGICTHSGAKVALMPTPVKYIILVLASSHAHRESAAYTAFDSV